MSARLARYAGFVLLLSVTVRAGATGEALRFTRSLAVAPGWARLELPLDVLDAAQPDLADLRIEGPEGELPYAFEDDLAALPQVLPFYDVQRELQHETTALVDRGPRPSLISCVNVDLEASASFLKPVFIEASTDAHVFKRIAEGSVFRVGGQGETELCFPANDERYLKFHFDDRNSQPIQPLKLEAATQAAEAPRHTLSLPFERVTGEGERIAYLLTLPSHHLPMQSLQLTVGDAVFSRLARVYERIVFRDELSKRLVGFGRIERALSGEPELSIHLGHVSSVSLELEIEPAGLPLQLEKVAAVLEPRALVFLAPEHGPFALRYGGEHLSAPASDVAQVLRKSRPKQFLAASLGAVKEAASPVAAPPARGPRLDPAAFGIARALQLPPAGRTAYVDIPGEITPLLDSVRILDATGQQVPYVSERQLRTRKAPLTLTVTRNDALTIAKLGGFDSQQSAVGLELVATGPDYFSRPVRLIEPISDERGVVERRVVASEVWLRRPSEPMPELTFGYSGAARELEVEVDNGDNPPLQLTSARAVVQSERLDFIFTAGDKLTLLAKNPALGAPRYDLELIGAALVDSPGALASLGPEQRSPSSPAAAQPARVPAWFWPVAAGALGLVVLVLLRAMLHKSDPRP